VGRDVLITLFARLERNLESDLRFFFRYLQRPLNRLALSFSEG